MNAAQRVGALVTAAIFASGCMDTYSVSKQELSHLDGYDIHSEVHTRHGTFTEPPHVLLTSDGHVLDYTSNTQLRLLGDAGVPLAPPGPYEQIRVTDASFEAVLLQGVPVKVPLDHVREVQVVENEYTGAALLLLGILAGFVITAVAIKEANASSSASAAAVVHPESHLLK